MKKNGKSVLIVEDDPLNIRVFGNTLRTKGYRVYEDHTGAECLDIARFYRPDMIIMDVNLPAACGIDLTRELRENPRTARIPILAASAMSGVDVGDVLSQAGASYFLRKPFSLNDLLRWVEHLLHASEQEKISLFDLSRQPSPPLQASLPLL